MQPTDLWVAFGLLVVAILAALGALIRYVVSVLRDVDKRLDDKLSVGEFTRRHEDLERALRVNYEQRLRSVERWQDQLNGEIRRRRPNSEEKC
jgi:cytochrome c biogenesis factor